MKKLWKCSLCGKVDFWGEEWSQGSSVIVDDMEPESRVVMCSDACATKCAAMREAGTLALPVFRPRGGMAVRVKARKGYEAQPSRAELWKQWRGKALL